MGEVRKYAPHRRWTKEEENRLIALSEVMTNGKIAKELGRSASSVKSKRISMGISSYTEQTDDLTIAQIAELVGVDKTTISKTWRKYGMRFRTVGCYKVTKEKTLLAFMQKHPELWKASKCDYYFFCQNEWFMERLEAERAGIDKGNHYRNRREWTNMELGRLKMLKRRGLSHREIANELGRTKRSIDHMVMRCKKKEDYGRIIQQQ